MIATLILLVALSVPTFEQNPQVPISPCPDVFQYEPPKSDNLVGQASRWYGSINLSTENTLHSLWLNIVLDRKADILGNWIGDVTTTDNIDFRIENTTLKINPGSPISLRFFVQYSSVNLTPRLHAIRLNGIEICNADTPQPTVGRPDLQTERPVVVIPELTRPVQRPDIVETRPVVTRPVATRPVATRPGSNPDTNTIGPVYEGSNNPLPVAPSISGEDPSQIVNNVARPNSSPGRRPTMRPPPPREDVSSGEEPSQFGNNGARPNNVFPVNASPGRVPTRRPSTSQEDVSFGDSSSQFGNNGARPNSVFQVTPSPGRVPTRRPPPPREDVSSGDDADYFEGGQPTFIIPSNTGSTNPNRSTGQIQCGKVVLNNPVPLVVNGTPTMEGQWPWQIALYQTQTIDNKYICGGTLISHRHVITAAHCITRKKSKLAVNKATLMVYLGKHNLRTSVEGVQIKFVDRIIVHPEYNASSYSRDVAILELRDPVTYSDWVRPACLWPENSVDLQNIIGRKGSVVGWGFDDTGVASEELTLVEMPVVDQETCLRSYNEFFVRFTSPYTYCAGYRDGTSVCNGDSGGGMVFKSSGTWFLRGLVSLSVARQNEYRCDPSHYVIFTDLAKFSSWIKQNVNDF